MGYSEEREPNYPPYATYRAPAGAEYCEYCAEGWDDLVPGTHEHAYFVHRDGAARTADSLGFVFLRDVAELLQLPDDPNNLSAVYVVPADIVDPDGWYDNPDDSEYLNDEIRRAESALSDAGFDVTWDDGYVIERVTVDDTCPECESSDVYSDDHVVICRACGSEHNPTTEVS